ncbi:adenylate/guanylate cyclase domain-containing protein [Mesorhizobium sp.]|uniref:adenylate/guanylate cyclase domain-containing protein n=1 Tax=Mesorhizobium sp. TaxID=1871066 RepID=UPI000FE9F04A|nr:adenylate/guanylate cyclase domain-containing protein [Mesorhizobium sp.]RWI20431.1 MAG: adenylate/guanylate cyclase domain-containing protein [Mesorhizobium sp.]RWK48315.1 MAG: adenylate/guanylate cyclase domain-containing protein [Mesorhizobium sp.]RWK95630.1 MAG: adenylate/guanylate cyclase domain-containing protein [Mesorhizobium sp.]TIP61363.1 MAG: adenylate/guanylate cyclase domain-containing protein [Mesorhizobium sp.]TIQ32862.1 MAG: adenylate/guanylate cyclase domain-containing prot
MDRKLAAILAADVVGYSKMMESDEQGTFERLRSGRKELFEPEIARHHGRIFKLMGDGLLAEFASVVDAVECAVALQCGLAERNSSVAEDDRINVRIGVNLGELIIEGEDFYGEGVNIAARLEHMAEPGSVYVSGKVAHEVEKKLSFGFEPLGKHRMKNIDEPVSVFRVKVQGTPKIRSRSRRRSSFVPWAVAASVAVLAAAGGAWLYFDRLGTPASGSAPSIAVLAFDNMSGDPSLGYFSDGVSEDIIAGLARSTDLSVIARNSSFTYKGKPTDVRQIGTDLNVNYVLEGSVRKDADQVRIVAQLINAKTGAHVWAERFDQSGSNPMALQDAVTERIVGALASETGQIKRSSYREAWGKDAASLQEYDYYLRGHDKLLQNTREAVEEAYQIWTEAISKYPESSLLKFKMGFLYYIRASNGWSKDPEEDLRLVGEMAREGMSKPNLSPLEKKLGNWLLAYASHVERDFKKALAQAEAAIAMAPGDAYMAAVLADVATGAGDTQKAVSWSDFGIRNDPALSYLYLWFKGWALTAGGKYQDSAAVMEEQDDWVVHIPVIKAINFVNMGMLEEAKANIKKALEFDPSWSAAKWREITFVDDEVLDRQVSDLIKAGLPER